MAQQAPIPPPWSNSPYVIVPITCEVWVWQDPYGPQMELWVQLRMYAEGEQIAEGEFLQGSGLYQRLDAAVEVGRDTDVGVTCIASGTVGNGVVLDLPRRQPDAVVGQTVESLYTAPGDYYLRREYTVTDNYGQRYGFANIPVTEDWYEQFDECNIQIEEQPLSGFLQSSGTFPDQYGHVPGVVGGTIPACSIPAHSSCETGAWQTYHLESRSFTHYVSWRCSGVVVYR